MVSKQLLVFFLFFFSSEVLYSQIIDLNGRSQIDIGKWAWQEGGVEFKSGKQLQGHIKYASEQTSDILQLRISDTLYDYDARQIRLFWVFDDHVGIMRTFYALPYVQGKKGVEFRFFEALVDGEHMLVLQRITFFLERNYRYRSGDAYENLMQATSDSRYLPQFTRFNPGYLMGVDHNYTPYLTLFLITPSTIVKPYNAQTSLLNRPVRLQRPRRKLLKELIQDEKENMHAFMAKHKIKYYNPQDIVRLVQHYNEIKYRSE